MKKHHKRLGGVGTEVVPTSSRFDPLKCLSLYSGQILLGHLLRSARGVEAFVDGESIGVFRDQKLAADAVTKVANHG